MLYGPNTNNGSIITMIEYQVDHVLRQIQRIAREDLAWIDVSPRAMERYNDEIQRRARGVDALAGAAAPATTARRAAASSRSGRARCRRWSSALASLDEDAYEAARAGLTQAPAANSKSSSIALEAALRRAAAPAGG